MKYDDCSTPLNRATQLLLLLISGTALYSTSQAAETAPVQLEAMVVTGEKTQRSLIDTATAVTVLGGDELDQGQYESINELSARAPNVITNPTGGINIRGAEGTGPAIGVQSFISGGRPRVSTLIDGTSEVWSGQQYLDAGLWDVEQVEILRGPQSTTQGRNAIGGAMVINTKDPTFHLEGAVRAGWADEDGRANVAAMVSAPLIANELAFRLAADVVRGNSPIDYAGNWPWWNPSKTDHSTIRGKLLWKPQNQPDLEAKLTLSRRDYDGQYMSVINSKDPKDMLYSPHRFSSSRHQDSSNTTASIDTSYQINEHLAAHLLYSYSDNLISFEQRPTYMRLKMDEQSHTAEARLVFNVPEQRLEGVAGLYVYQRNQELKAGNKEGNAVNNVFDGTDKLGTIAAYTDLTWGLSEQWKVLLGARVEQESQDRDVIGWGKVPIKADISKSVFLPKLGLAWEYAPNSSVAFTVREGYNPGAGALDEKDRFYQYDSESVWAYELSAKSIVRPGLLLTGNLFYNDYRDYQVLHGGRLQNLPESRTYGLELSADMSLADGWQLFGSLGLLKTEVQQSGQWGSKVDGNELSYAPNTTAGLGVRKQWGAWQMGVDAQYVAEYFTDLDNAAKGAAGNYVVTNLQASYTLGQATLRAYVKNLFNDDVVTRRFSGSRSSDYYVGSPRTVGMNVEYRF
jgi:iron complex outermembrane recepter protein